MFMIRQSMLGTGKALMAQQLDAAYPEACEAFSAESDSLVHERSKSYGGFDRSHCASINDKLQVSGPLEL